MKVEGGKKLARQLGDLPDHVQAKLAKVIRTSTEEGARVARTLAPDVTGETRSEISTQYRDGGLHGEVVVIRSDAPKAEKDRAYAIEYGRKRGQRGTTEGYHFVYNTRLYLGRKFKGRIKRAIKAAVKEVTNG